MRYPYVKNLESPRSGRPVANQFIIVTAEGQYFQSYRTLIAFRMNSGKVLLDHKWNCSRTTSKYRNEFLDECTAETRKKIDEGIYSVVDLNE